MNVVAKRRHQHPVRINRPRKIERRISDLFETERHVIGRIADQDDGLGALPPCGRNGDPDEFPAYALVFVRRPNRKRAKHMALHPAGQDGRHAHRSDRLTIISADEGQRPVMRTLLTDARRRTGVPAGTKCFFVDDFDDGVVRRVLGEVDKIVLGHEETETSRMRMRQ
ncbi:hypothetical protein D3C78_1159760 [compost metagenome]